jgi:hypothetical protein
MASLLFLIGDSNLFLTLRNKKIEVLEEDVPGEYLDKRKLK